MFKKWFTLVEIMIWILITSTIIIIWFQALTTVTVWKIKLIESTNIEKETFLFTQKLFEEIKAGWLIDYEEYFNRKVVGNTSYASWHYNLETWFWNFWNWGNVWSTSYWDGFYYCRSWDLNQMWTWGCVEADYHSWSTSYAWESQRYGQYSFQFIDYNSNADWDLWDEDWDTKIIWDDDDEYLWEWPIVFTWWTDIKELYLISWDKTKRTIFRWTVWDDLNKPSSSNCNTTDWKTFTWTWCLWTIEFLRLEWKDWWMDHTAWNSDSWEYDWVIDTWLINPDFTWWWNVVAGSTWTWYWLPLFPDTINVANFEVYAYPNKDIKHAWKDYSPETNLSPYVRLKLKLTPSWKVKKKIKWKIPEFEINTTISLTDIYSR